MPTAATFSLTRDKWGRLSLIDAEGARHTNVRAARMFPITDPEHWIVLRDEQGRELADVEDLEQLPEPTRRLLHEELARSGFLPRIRRILSVTRTGDALRWEAETDRGVTSFRLENAEAMRSLGGNGMLLVDEHGIRYLVPDMTTLDAASRRKLERCMY